MRPASSRAARTHARRRNGFCLPAAQCAARATTLVLAVDRRQHRAPTDRDPRPSQNRARNSCVCPINVLYRCQSEAQLPGSRGPSDFACFWSLNERHQDASPALLAVRAIPHLHRVIGLREAAEPFLHSVTGARLQVNAGHAVVRQAGNRGTFGNRERWRNSAASDMPSERRYSSRVMPSYRSSDAGNQSPANGLVIWSARASM